MGPQIYYIHMGESDTFSEKEHIHNYVYAPFHVIICMYVLTQYRGMRAVRSVNFACSPSSTEFEYVCSIILYSPLLLLPATKCPIFLLFQRQTIDSFCGRVGREHICIYGHIHTYVKCKYIGMRYMSMISSQ
jgi:hypothetical protein